MSNETRELQTAGILTKVNSKYNYHKVVNKALTNKPDRSLSTEVFLSFKGPILFPPLVVHPLPWEPTHANLASRVLSKCSCLPPPSQNSSEFFDCFPTLGRGLWPWLELKPLLKLIPWLLFDARLAFNLWFIFNPLLLPLSCSKCLERVLLRNEVSSGGFRTSSEMSMLFDFLFLFTGGKALPREDVDSWGWILAFLAVWWMYVVLEFSWMSWWSQKLELVRCKLQIESRNTCWFPDYSNTCTEIDTWRIH